MYCFLCKKNPDLEGRIGFRAVCPHCDADLHVCCNCKHYAPGKPGNCMIPDIDPVYDPQKANFCEEFVPSTKTPDNLPKKPLNDTAKKIFSEEPPKPTDFNSLFKLDFVHC